MGADLRSLLRTQGFPIRLKIVDAGAAQFEDAHNRLVDLAERFGGEVFAFEPNPDAHQKLKEIAKRHPNLHVLPLALGDGEEHELKVCRHPGGTSLFEPNLALARRYEAFAEWLEVVDRIKLKTVKLDEVAEVRGVHFLKIDIQGAELAALQCATSLFSTLLLVECEVNFVQQYIDQPLFSEIELFLRRHGFMFHKFCGYGSRQIAGTSLHDDPLSPGSQWLWSDAVFVRDISHWATLSDDQLIIAAIFLHELYDSNDLALHALATVDARRNTRVSEFFARSIGRGRSGAQ